MEISKDDKGGFRKGDYTFNCEATSYKMRDDGDAYRKDQHPLGRFPANLIHDGSDEVVSLFPNTKSGKMDAGVAKHSHWKENIFDNPETYGDSGSASRFFKTCEFTEDDFVGQRFLYQAKASKSERNK